MRSCVAARVARHVVRVYHRSVIADPAESKPEGGSDASRQSANPRADVMERMHPAPDLLLKRIAAGDAGAVRECMDRFGGLVWSLARRFTFNDAEAQDAVQEVFVEVWKNAHRYDESVASETAFVAMLARRRLIDRRRRSDRRIDKSPLPEATPAVDAARDSLAVVSEDAKRAVEALQDLSPEQQRVLRLSIFHGLSHEKIATATGLPMGTVKTHARRGLMRLRELLGAEPPRTAGEAQP